MSGVSAVLAWPLLSLAIAIATVRGAIWYAMRHGMLDQPGRRRSHTVATPRGGGIGIVVACLVTLPWAWGGGDQAPSTVVRDALLAGVAMVATVGWLDDRHALPALPRLLVQLAACSLLALALIAEGLSYWWALPLVLAGTWSINLHNFMDGIDGLLAQQAMFVTAGLGVLGWLAQQPGLSLAAVCVFAACLGFWYFNRSPARIFMGDAGSGSVGLLLFALSAVCATMAPRTLPAVLVLSAAFVVDASLTLLSRMCRGRRWYTPHREHLYQWLARRLHSHARVCALFMGWNLLVLVPLAWLAWSSSMLAYGAVVLAYLLTIVAWFVFKHRCLRRRASGMFDVVA
ncbi:MAG: glycosyltransferase family 4 protein [Rhodanobacter sp.]|nr:MAG: glycosyltransferase family 4 protein [Rhodanobacter sp.]TAM09996.1 MAG: glycosyltransferase family 4 protein [Rhodanobacter sp.]TAM34691.1 MAG: glycosyltransferase family 4 protein [Rhodanobacter sp.]